MSIESKMAKMASCCWTNELVLKFIELYQAEPLLWNPRHSQHKNRNAVIDAWQRIQVAMNCQFAIAELKKKRESLMSTYRLHSRKLKQSIRSGASTDELYTTNWFAYTLMDSFLGPVYSKDDNVTINTETCQFSNEQSEATEMSENIESEPPNRDPETISTSSRKRRNPELTQAKKQMDQAFNMISNISARRELHQVDLFCELLSKKIKKLNEASQEEIMDEIDALMYNKKRCVSRNEFYATPSPQSGSSTSSVYMSRNEFYAAPSSQSYVSSAVGISTTTFAITIINRL